MNTQVISGVELSILRDIAGIGSAPQILEQFPNVKAGMSDYKCNYCVWIVDDALTQFDRSKDYNAIVASRKPTWHQWVKEKIDGGDFRNLTLKLEKVGQQEINLSDMSEHVAPD